MRHDRGIMRMKNLRLGKMHLVLAAGTALGVASQAAYAAEPEKPKERGARVIVVQAAEGCFSQTVHGTGLLLPRSEAIVTIDPQGYQVTEVLAREGDSVKAGQPLARLSHVGASRPGQELPSVIVLRAPSAGRIEKSTATVGTVAAANGKPLFQIATSDEIEMVADVPGLSLDKVAVGQAAQVDTVGGEVQGRVRLIASSVNKESQLGHVHISLAADPALHVGSFGQAKIDAGRSCGVSVPRTAVLYGADGTSVQVVRGRIVEKHRVRVGLLSDHDAEIKEGVQVGDIVVAHAGTSLRDGDEVTTLVTQASGRAGQP
jgi:multidrug efflux pump subunit AcrA (membrane-fusion protein)